MSSGRTRLAGGSGRAAEDATGQTAAVEAETDAAAAFNAAGDAVTPHQPRRPAGLAREALWVAEQLAREAGGDDPAETAETVVRRAAASGGPGAARPRPGRPDAFEAADPRRTSKPRGAR